MLNCSDSPLRRGFWAALSDMLATSISPDFRKDRMGSRRIRQQN
jgi:hypothetical protein